MGKGLPGPTAFLSRIGYRREKKRNASVGLDEVAAAVFLPAGFAMLRAEGLLLAEADRGELAGRDAQRSQVRLYRGGAAVAEAEVVFCGAAFVAVPSMVAFTEGCAFKKSAVWASAVRASARMSALSVSK